MMALVPESSPPVRSPFWRVLQLIVGAALFLYALRVLPPMPFERVGFVVIVAVLAAGAMGLSDSLIGLAATAFENLQKGGKQ